MIHFRSLAVLRQAAVALGLASIAFSASAATYVITYKGSVQSALNVNTGTPDSLTSWDTTGVFGVVNRDLAHLSFTAVYTLTVPMLTAQLSNTGADASIQGGALYGPGVASPMAATLTIDGRTVSFDGLYQGRAYQFNSSIGDQVKHEVWQKTSVGSIGTSNFMINSIGGPNIVSSVDYTQPLNYLRQLSDYSIGQFQVLVHNDALGDTTLARGQLLASSVMISAVPEPSVWVSMTAGLMLVGAIRKRKVRMAT